MRVLLETHPAFVEHNAGPGHPERPGAGLDAVERLERGEADAAFCAVRPSGHHAAPAKAMGFCLLDSVAVCAAVVADRGERVVVVDWDAHRGNAAARVGALAGIEPRPEPATSGGPGIDVVEAAARLRSS